MFWFRGKPYRLTPDEILPPTTYSPRYGLVPVPTADGVSRTILSTYRGTWDYAARLSVDSAVVQWRGLLPCSWQDSLGFLRSIPGRFLLGTNRPPQQRTPLFVMGLDLSRSQVYGIFTVDALPNGNDAMEAGMDATWSHQLVQDGLLAAPMRDPASESPLDLLMLKGSSIPYKEVFHSTIMEGVERLLKEFPEANPALLMKKIVREALDGYMAGRTWSPPEMTPIRCPEAPVAVPPTRQMCRSFNPTFLFLAVVMIVIVLGYLLVDRLKR